VNSTKLPEEASGKISSMTLSPRRWWRKVKTHECFTGIESIGCHLVLMKGAEVSSCAGDELSC